MGIPSNSRDLPDRANNVAAPRPGHPEEAERSEADGETVPTLGDPLLAPILSSEARRSQRAAGASDRDAMRTGEAASRAGPKTAGDRRLADQLLRLIGLRIAIVTSVLLPAFLIDIAAGAAGDAAAEAASVSFEVLLQTAGLAYLASLVYVGIRLWSRLSPAAQAYAQLVGDLLLVSFLVSQTGGAMSPFSSLYLLVITVASTLLRRRSGVIVATGASALFAMLATASARGWLEGDVPSIERVVYSLFLHFLGFYAVALLTAYLARDVARVERELEVASEDLADLETLHRYVVASITSGLVTTDLDGRITTINPAGRAILDRREEDLLGRHVAELGLMDEAEWLELSEHGPHERPRCETTLEIAREARVIGYSVAELLDHEDRRRGFTVVFQDLTPWRRLQEQLRLKDRMAAVGEMAAGLAHEIGNPLAAISGSVQLLSSIPGRSSAESRLLRIVLQESQRLDRTIKSFLAYARPAPRRLAPFDVGALLSEHVELLRNSRECEPHHRIELEVEPASFELVGDRDRIQQILWNLSRNALRAMKDGGRLRLSGRPENRSYTIRVEDTGSGMTEEQKAKLFQPYQSFFDGGTGIGMAIVYRIVQEHEGEIEVDTGPSRTTITVRLPLRASGVGESTARAQESPA